MRSNAGFSLIELVIAVVIAGLVIAAGMSVAVQQRMFYTSMADAAGAARTLNQLDLTLASELLPLNPSAGDMVYAGSDSMRTRLFGGVYFVCDKDASQAELTLRRLTQGGIPEVGDSALVYSTGPTADVTDDAWEPMTVTQAGSGLCPDSSQAYTVRTAGLNSAEFNSVTVGSPLRVFETVSYWFRSAEDGWHLMRTNSDGSRIKLAGPFTTPIQEGSAPAFEYYDALGVATAVESEVSRVDVSLSAVRLVSGTNGDPKPVHRDLSFKLRND